MLMRTALRALAAAIVLAGATPAAQAQTQTFVDFSSHYTQRLQDLAGGVYGAVPADGVFATTGGIDFHVGLNSAPNGNNLWNANYDGQPDGGGTRTLDLTVSIANPTHVYTLVNTWWGASTPNIARVEFFGTGGAYLKRELIGGTHMRDWYNNIWTNTITDPNTVEVFTGQNVRLDRMGVDLGAAFAGQTLTGIRFTDGGGWNQQRLMVSGITVVSTSTVPEPGTVALLATGLVAVGAGAWRRRRVTV